MRHERGTRMSMAPSSPTSQAGPTALAGAMAPPLLEVTALSVAYGKVEAVHQVSLRLNAGSIATVVGPNGAGKTTLLAAIMGLLPSQGSVRINGIEQQGVTVEERVANGLSLVPEKRELFGEMSVQNNLELGALTRYRRGERGLDASLESIFQMFPRLKERRRQLAGTLSGGERQMLAFGRALMAKPRLLMLDEPSLGLAPRIVRDIFQTIVAMREQAISILLVEQNARAALQLADYGYVLENGELALEGRGSELLVHPQVIASYLGINVPKVDSGNAP
jgi:branched-chain amino acid transport system ATP-binding protein